MAGHSNRGARASRRAVLPIGPTASPPRTRVPRLHPPLLRPISLRRLDTQHRETRRSPQRRSRSHLHVPTTPRHACLHGTPRYDEGRRPPRASTQTLDPSKEGGIDPRRPRPPADSEQETELARCFGRYLKSGSGHAFAKRDAVSSDRILENARHLRPTPVTPSHSPEDTLPRFGALTACLWARISLARLWLTCG